MALYMRTGALTSPKEMLPDQIARGTLDDYPRRCASNGAAQARPTWLGRLSLVVGAAAAATAAFVGIFASPAWILVGSVRLLARRA
jgi:hypothetical protein